jgi:hypothetical protein
LSVAVLALASCGRSAHHAGADADANADASGADAAGEAATPGDATAAADAADEATTPEDATAAADAADEATTLEDATVPPPADATSADDGADVDAARGCLPGMVPIDAFCVDPFEAYVVAIDDAGNESPHSPYDTIDAAVRAKSAAGVVPQGYISQVQADEACRNAGKRLCTMTEFATFCRGGLDSGADYPYGGTTHMPGACNEGKASSVPLFFGSDPQSWTYADLNDPRLNQWDGGLAPTGSYPLCVSPFGVYDCVGNLLEWGADPADANGHGRLRGGYYGDTETNGPGCLYLTSAHELAYHDYSTGFRCCMDAVGGE